MTSHGIGNSISRRQLLAGAAAVAVSGSVTPTTAVAAMPVVKLSNTVRGPGLPIFGINGAHFLAGGNTTAWLRYSRFTAIRVFAAASHWIGDEQVPDQGVSDLASFDQAKARARANPEGVGAIDWPAVLDRYENHRTTTNVYTLNFLMQQVSQLGFTVLIETDVASVQNAVGDIVTWDEGNWPRFWRNWMKTYAHAYYLAKNFGVVRFATQNEPDAKGHRDRIESMPHYLRCLRFTSDAVRCGVADAGAAIGRPLQALVHAPVVTRSTMMYGAVRKPWNIESNPMTAEENSYYGGDDRDQYTGWGQAALEGMRHDYHLQQVDHDLFDVFDTHCYDHTAAWYAGEVGIIRSKISQYAAGSADLPVVYTELNRYNTSSYANLNGETIDTTRIAREIGEIAATSTTAGVDGLFHFKLANVIDPETNRPHGTGFYYVNGGEPYDILGASRGAEALRLVGRGLTGDLHRLATSVASAPAGFTAWGSHSARTRSYHLLTAQGTSGTAVFDLDLSALSPGTEAGQIVTIEEVSDRRAGGIARYVPVGSGPIRCSQPANSLWLITVPEAGVSEQPALVVAQNAMVRDGADADRALGSGAGLAVQRSTNGPDEVTLLQFPAASPGGALVRAVLEIYAHVPTGKDLCTFSVFARPDWAWNQSTITWNDTPYLSSSNGSVITGSQDVLWPAGQLTVTEDFTHHRLDVTDIVAAHPSASLTFILIKQPRYNGDNAQYDRRVTLVDKESTAAYAHPRLRVWTA